MQQRKIEIATESRLKIIWSTIRDYLLCVCFFLLIHMRYPRFNLFSSLFKCEKMLEWFTQTKPVDSKQTTIFDIQVIHMRWIKVLIGIRVHNGNLMWLHANVMNELTFCSQGSDLVRFSISRSTKRCPCVDKTHKADAYYAWSVGICSGNRKCASIINILACSRIYILLVKC